MVNPGPDHVLLGGGRKYKFLVSLFFFFLLLLFVDSFSFRVDLSGCFDVFDGRRGQASVHCPVLGLALVSPSAGLKSG